MKGNLIMETIMVKGSMFGTIRSSNIKVNLKKVKCMDKEYFKILMGFLKANLTKDI